MRSYPVKHVDDAALACVGANIDASTDANTGFIDKNQQKSLLTLWSRVNFCLFRRLSSLGPDFCGILNQTDVDDRELFFTSCFYFMFADENKMCEKKPGADFFFLIFLQMTWQISEGTKNDRFVDIKIIISLTDTHTHIHTMACRGVVGSRSVCQQLSRHRQRMSEKFEGRKK